MAERNAAMLEQRITTEIEGLTNHYWAGEYYRGDGLGENISLSLAPDAGYLCENQGCEGVYGRSYGHALGFADQVYLSSTVTNKKAGCADMPDELVVVRWGDRRYLIPTNQLIDFCSAVNNGNEPRKEPWGYYLLRRGDWEKGVSGKPLIPKAYSTYMLDTAVTGVIVSVTGVTRRPSGLGWYSRQVTATLNIGRDNGLATGMKLQVVEPSNVLWEYALVMNVGQRTAQIMMSQFKEEGAFPTNGWLLSTRSSWVDGRR